MKVGYKKTELGYLPVIIHEDGQREVIQGPSLINIEIAKKYGKIEINKRYNYRRICKNSLEQINL